MERGGGREYFPRISFDCCSPLISINETTDRTVATLFKSELFVCRRSTRKHESRRGETLTEGPKRRDTESLDNPARRGNRSRGKASSPRDEARETVDPLFRCCRVAAQHREKLERLARFQFVAFASSPRCRTIRKRTAVRIGNDRARPPRRYTLTAVPRR